jgi:hypothetical protein
MQKIKHAAQAKEIKKDLEKIAVMDRVYKSNRKYGKVL